MKKRMKKLWKAFVKAAMKPGPPSYVGLGVFGRKCENDDCPHERRYVVGPW